MPNTCFLDFPKNFHTKEILIIWHVGFDEKLVDFLEKHSSLEVIFFEESVKKYQDFLTSSEASFFTKHSRVKFVVNDFEKLGYELAFASYAIAFWNSTSTEEKKRSENFCQKHQRDHEAFFSYVYDFGERTFENFFQNIRNSNEKFSIQKMEKNASLLPAIICGAGPSLKKAYPILKKWEDYALIFAGGTAMNFLQRYGVDFHFGASVEKQALQKRFLEILPHQKLFSIPGASHENFSLFSGKNFWASQIEALPLQKFLEEKLFAKAMGPPIDPGFCVTSFLVSIAHFLGCSPIILVGVDLCYENDQKYPEKLEGQSEEKIWCETFQKMTQKDWLVTKNWLEEFAKTHQDIEWINASEGLPFENPFQSLSLDKIEKKLSFPMDLKGFSHFLSEKAEPLIEKENVENFLSNFEKEIEEFLKLLEDFFSEEIKINSAIQETYILKKSLAFYLLNPLWVVFRPLLKRRMDLLDPTCWHEQEYIHRFLFYKRVCETFKHMMQRINVCLSTK